METETSGGETATEKRQRSSRHGRGIDSAMRCAVNAAATQEQQWREWRRHTARWQGRSFWGGCRWEKEGRPPGRAAQQMNASGRLGRRGRESRRIRCCFKPASYVRSPLQRVGTGSGMCDCKGQGRLEASVDAATRAAATGDVTSPHTTTSCRYTRTQQAPTC